jgi:hypothetical protein
MTKSRHPRHQAIGRPFSSRVSDAGVFSTAKLGPKAVLGCSELGLSESPLARRAAKSQSSLFGSASVVTLS